MTDTAHVRVLGVHPVPESIEPCHLVEILVEGAGRFEIGDITQEKTGQPRSEWQVPYDERPLAPAETLRSVESQVHHVFFFHYLDLSRPLLTPGGPVDLPEPSPRPERLRFIAYEAP